MNSFAKSIYRFSLKVLNHPENLQKLKGSLTICNFHQVSPSFNPALHDPGTWTSFDAFKNLVERIKQHHEITSLPNAIELLKKRQIGRRSLFCITFDDGDVSLKSNVLPYLEKCKIPATFFVNTGYLDSNQTNWSQVCRYLKNTQPSAFQDIGGYSQITKTLRTTDDPNVYFSLLSKIEKAWTKIDEKPQFSLGKSDMESWSPELFTLGTHGHIHHRYCMLSYEQQKEDIQKSMEILGQYKNFVPYFAIPFGTEIDWDRNTLKVALEKKLTLLFHTNLTNKNWNNLGLDRVACDNKDYCSVINSIR